MSNDPLHDDDIRPSNRESDIGLYMFTMPFIHMHVPIASQQLLYFAVSGFQTISL
jgi:hypothetical protein